MKHKIIHNIFIIYIIIKITLEMNFNTINTKDKQIVKVNILKSVDIQVSDLVLNQKINLLVHLKDEENKIFQSQIVRIEGDEYNEWGINDEYLIDLVLKKIGAERKLDV